MTGTPNELIYNQKDVCEVFRERGEADALALIRSKWDCLLAESLAADAEGRRSKKAAQPSEQLNLQKKLLSSLNCNLFYYVLFSVNPAETCGCCPVQQLKGDIGKKQFMEIAETILNYYKGYVHPEQSPNRHIADACQYISEHLSEDLTLETVASNIYVGRCHLCWLFRNVKHIRFSEYITRERLKKARELLLSDELSIDSVAEQCGFSSSSYFSTVFKKYEKISPRDYRKLHMERAGKSGRNPSP